VGVLLLHVTLWGQENASASSTPVDGSKFPISESSDIQQKSPSSKSIHSLTGSTTFLSDYRSRGISQTMRRPAVQGELKYQHISGYYLKSWASNVDGTTHFINNTSMEWDFYLGCKQDWGSSIKTDMGLLFYYYPGGQAFVPERVSYNTVEYYIALNYKIFTIRMYQTLTDFFGVNSANPPFNWEKNRLSRPNGHSQGSPYIEVNAEWSPHAKWKTSLHLGYQSVVDYPQLSYFDWQIGLIYSAEWFDLSLFYIATNAKRAYYDVLDNAFEPSSKHLGAPCLVFGVTKEF
jgi:uncharacterized protein (TIGR02001 family)